MLFSGTELIQKRNFYTQYLDYGFVMSATVDNTTGIYHFGLTGSNGILDFRLESGRLYYQDNFIHTYKPYEQFIIDAQFSSGSINILKNNSPLIYGITKQTGLFDYFYFTRETTQMAAEFELKISGDNIANYTISNQGYLYSSGQEAVTGWFVNRGNFPIRVFDSAEQSSVIYDFGKLIGDIGANGGSGAFAYTGDYDILDFSQPILTTFTTNYGNSDILFSIIDARSFDWFVQFTAPTNFSFNSDNILNRDLSYLNFSGGFVTDDYNTRLSFALDYVSGSGYYTSFTGYSAIGYGNFSQSGLVTGLLITVTGNRPVTGFGWATGVATGFFSGMGTGIISGIGYTGIGTGYMTGLATGFINAGSGTLDLIYPLIGLGISATGTFAPVGQPYTGAFPIIITGSGFYTNTITGSDYLPYEKTFTGIWQFFTGIDSFNLVPVPIITSTLYSGQGVFSPNSYINFQVTYITSGSTPDGASLFITGTGVINGINQQLSMP